MTATRRTNLRPAALGVLLVCLALLAACSRPGQGQRPAAAPTAPATAEPSPAATPAGGASSAPAERIDPRAGGLEVGFGEFAISLETRAVRPGPVTFVVRNGGKLVHGFELKSEGEGGTHGGRGHGDRFELEAPTFGPGDTIRLRTDLAPGTYEMECYVANHDALGMRTILVVRPDAPLVRPDAAAPGAVSIRGFAFAPLAVTVPVGSRVTWTNRDPAAHTVTADGGEFGSDPLAGGRRFVATFRRPGTFAYHCAIHPTMRGTVVVR